MKIGLTGGTGFIGRYLINRLCGDGHTLRCWHRPASDTSGFNLSDEQLEWIPGRLADASTATRLVEGCDAVVHSALDRPGSGFRGAEGDLATFVETNVLGTIRLIESAKAAGVSRFIFISTCAVHEEILDDRPLDETHPLWPRTHYGAHKAAIEKFVNSYGLGEGYDICALRPSGVYGVTRPPRNSKWFPLIDAVVRGEDVDCQKGGKE
ncbi:MAG: NAD(P)-dependent oxidoreductase, partial [Planctomycetota bacterium]